MSRPHYAARLALLCACLLTFNAAAFGARQTTPAPSESAARGVEAYRAADFKRAVKLLREAVKRDREDARSWLYLGLAYSADGKRGDARKAGERALELHDARFWKQYQEWHDDKADAAPRAEREARRTSESAALAAAVSDIAQHVGRAPRDADFWRTQHADWNFYALTAAETERTVYRPAEVTKKVVFRHKPEPGYVEEARKKGVEGIVRLRALLRADGSVGHIFVLRHMPEGLTDRAISAARLLSFEPAEKDGRPVSQWVILEYHFNIHN
ncbi:MAG TPA: TonB family protein [Pyrinomonadaceae bacterium]|nr:TonB family protein [Pyrinomonadaceae bacterium]